MILVFQYDSSRNFLDKFIMKAYAVLTAICAVVVFAKHTVAEEYFQLFTGTTVWARTSFRIRRPVSEQICAKTCIETSGCSSFVYGRITRYCYGRKITKSRSRRHWHLSRRYDYYKKLTGNDRTRVEELIPDSGETEIVFVRRVTSRYRDELVAFKRLDKFGREIALRVEPTTTTRRPTTTTRKPTITRRPTTTTTTTRPTTTTVPTTTTRYRRPIIRPRPTFTTRTRRPTIATRTRRPSITRRPVTTKQSRIPVTIATTRRPIITPRTRRPTTTRSTTTTTRPTTTTTRPATTTRKTTTTLNPYDPLCEKPIGMEDESFPRAQLSASSSYWRYVPSNGAINTGNGWMAGSTSAGEYYQIDFQEPKLIKAVATQGSTYLFGQEFVAKYKLKFLLHPLGNFETYKENNAEVIFNGNDDSSTIVKNKLNDPVRAFKMQIHPTEFFNNIMMRVEVFESC